MTQTQPQMPLPDAGSAQSTSAQKPLPFQRLPCRGCTVACKNYTRCDGKPWRMNS